MCPIKCILGEVPELPHKGNLPCPAAQTIHPNKVDGKITDVWASLMRTLANTLAGGNPQQIRIHSKPRLPGCSLHTSLESASRQMILA